MLLISSSDLVSFGTIWEERYREPVSTKMRFVIAVIFFTIALIFIFTKVSFIDERRNLIIPKPLTKYHLPPYNPKISPTVGGWQNVNATMEKFYVYSAFFEHREEQRLIRIIAVTKRKRPEKVWCRFWYIPIEVNLTKTTTAEVEVIQEHHDRYYSACFILCHLEKDQPVPAMVSVVVDVLYPHTNLLIVNDNHNVNTPINKLGVCIKPFIYNYNETLRVLEFIELNLILGVSHFTLYNHTIGSQVNCLLKYYISRGIVTIHSWQLEITSLEEIHIFGLIAAFNDCLYRSMYRFSHILFIDFDEYVIPRHNYSLPQLIHYLEQQQQKLGQKLSTGSYSFQNAFFYLYWDDDKWVYDTNETIAVNLLTLKKTKRTVQLNPHGVRSKYICKPERVVEVGNHFVWKFIPGYNTYNVPSDDAILHHYRADCAFENTENCLKLALTIDTTAFRYRDSLVSVVKEIYPYIKDKCGLDLEGLPVPRLITHTLD